MGAGGNYLSMSGILSMQGRDESGSRDGARFRQSSSHRNLVLPILMQRLLRPLLLLAGATIVTPLAEIRQEAPAVTS